MTHSSTHRREIRILAICIFAVAALVIWVRTATVRDTYLYVQNEKEFRKIQQEIQASRVRWLKQTSPRRLETLAQSLGLSAPGLQQVFKYKPTVESHAHAATP